MSAWYRAVARDLPWRQTSDPYRILVSEVMLQQTQVARVVPRYRRFLDRFPTVESLASAPRSTVLAEWSGLGYNTRAVRLHEAARVVARDGWPRSAAELRELPGIGPYTAAAVASFAFGEKVAAVDTNVRRVLSRWAGGDLSGRDLAAHAAAALDHDDPATWNQAMMELGATVCRPRDPNCAECPASSWCTDPSVRPAVARQPAFQGSLRQVRGAVVRTLTLRSSATVESLVSTTGHDLALIDEAVSGLERDGVVVRDRSSVRLPN